MKTWLITGCSTGIGRGIAKAARELVSEAVDKESARLGIQVMIVEPGAFRTNFYDSLKRG